MGCWEGCDGLTIAYCQHVSCSLSPATQQYGGGGDGRRLATSRSRTVSEDAAVSPAEEDLLSFSSEDSD